MTQEQQLVLDQLFAEARYSEITEEFRNQDISGFDEVYISKIALSFYHIEHYGLACGLFEQICSKTDDAVSWFNLASASILNNNEVRGLDALRHAIKYNTEQATNGKGIPTPFMLLYIAQTFVNANKYNQAYNQLNELAAIYTTSVNTDDEYLYSKGIPLFDEFVKLAKKILPLQKVVDSKQWVAYISDQLDETGKLRMKSLT